MSISSKLKIILINLAITAGTAVAMSKLKSLNLGFGSILFAFIILLIGSNSIVAVTVVGIKDSIVSKILYTFLSLLLYLSIILLTASLW